MATRKKRQDSVDIEQSVLETPSSEQEHKELPDPKQNKKEIPSAEIEKKEQPKTGHPENMVLFGNTPIEIFPTKLEYFRNKTANFYHVLQVYPIGELLNFTEKDLGGRDGDKATFDWLIAITDNEELVKANYNLITQDTIDKLVEIFIRVNKIKEKEEKLKNLMAPKSQGAK